MPEISHLRWSYFAQKTGGPYHIARVTMPAGRRSDLHTHDFAELFFVEQGRGIHFINGRRQALTRGNLVFVRPEDSHAFEPAGDGLTFVNVAMSVATIHILEGRYFRDRAWAWRAGGPPEVRQLRLEHLERASEWAERLTDAMPSMLLLDGFLLDLLSMHETDTRLDFPDWLNAAVKRFTTAEEFAGGAGRLAALAGRSPEHLNRTLRRITGRSTSEFINDLRVTHAARQLRLSDRSMADIAFGCGINHLTYFYRIFKDRMGTTPSRYRRSQRMGME
jgi:AraC family cel operon transcriptional repressor